MQWVEDIYWYKFGTILSDIQLVSIKVYKEGVAQMSREQGSMESLNQRAINAERARDDAIMQVETLQHKLRREENK